MSGYHFVIPSAGREKHNKRAAVVMGQTNRIILGLKRGLRSRGITYAMLAKRISLSEPSVKRILSRGSLSLPRLERICEATGISMEELVRPVPGAHSEPSSTLTAAQETALAADPQLLGCFYLLTNGHAPRDVAAELGADEKLLRRWLVKLDNLGLVELRARLGARLRVHAPISWREDGPIRRTYEHQVREEFMRSAFTAADESLHFRSAELSDASRQVLQRKLARLSADFNELAELDRHLSSREKRSVALMTACRPWVFSMFDGLRKR
jgi:transcriptional regulator with XRE-family HTH domain